jgi:hypothetical protein
MTTVQQVSVFVENVHGRLAEITRLLSNEQINLRAMTIADTADFGILRLIVSDASKAIAVLQEHNFTAKVTNVIGVEVDDTPGGLAEVLELFDKYRVNIEYLYVTLERTKDRAVVIFKVDDLDLGLRIADEAGLSLVSGF